MEDRSIRQRPVLGASATQMIQKKRRGQQRSPALTYPLLYTGARLSPLSTQYKVTMLMFDPTGLSSCFPFLYHLKDRKMRVILA